MAAQKEKTNEVSRLFETHVYPQWAENFIVAPKKG